MTIETADAMELPVRSERDPWWTAARAVIGGSFRAAFRVRVSGLENVPASGGALLTYNHVSVLDPIFVAIGAAERGRRVRFLALSGDFDRPVVGRVLRRLDMIPLRRGLGDWSAIEAVAEEIRRGGLAGMSPEGTVGYGAELQPLQRGAARIALAAGKPVVPVAVWGSQRRWPKMGLHLRGPARPTVAVAFGEPIEPVGHPKQRADVFALTERLAASLEALVVRARIEAGDG